ncbi:MAG: SDR family oxidoreductase [Myxococcales bacterium]|nr:SDR family oxidoreductase [Myxococcales bacterium]
MNANQQTSRDPAPLAIVVGGSRGLGRGIVEALVARGDRVISVARGETSVPGAHGVRGDATDEALADRLLSEGPALVVVCAGASPILAPFHQQTWEEFSTNWNSDTRSAFVWLSRALRRPLARGAHLIVVSSGAAIQGSPVSGGYAAAKRGQWMIADYARTEIERADLGLIVHCVLPQLNASTELGREGIRAYADRAGVPVETFGKRFEPALTPEITGRAVVELFAEPARFPQLAYKLTAAGLAAIP